MPSFELLRACRPALVAAGLMLGTAAWAVELSPQERLEAVRQELVKAALQGATQVQSTAWIDSTGALRESSSFRHGMQVRGVRVLAYQRDQSGQPQAQVQFQGREDAVRAAAAAAPAAPVAPGKAPAPAKACAPEGRLQHVLGWRLAVQGRWSPDEAPLAQDAAQALAQGWQRSAESARPWRLQELPPVSSVGDAGSGSAYERLLTAAPAAVLPAWVATFSLEPMPVLQPARQEGLALSRQSNAPGLRLTLTVSRADTAAPLYQASSVLAWSVQSSNWQPPRLSAEGRAALAQVLEGWVQALAERLVCEPVRVQVLQAQADRVQVDQGALAGLRVGEEWLLSDRQQVPQRLLEPGAASRLVLARVERVDSHRAELKVLAGGADQVRPRWQAWPMLNP